MIIGLLRAEGAVHRKVASPNPIMSTLPCRVWERYLGDILDKWFLLGIHLGDHDNSNQGSRYHSLNN